MNLELLNRAKEYVEKLANGINPTTGELVTDDSVVNDVKIIRCLFFIKDVLEDAIKNEEKTRKKLKKTPFNMTRDEINKYTFDKGDLSISKIVSEINNLKTDDNMMKLKTTDVTKWLLSINLLEETERFDKKVKLPTGNGLKMGMYVENRYGMRGNYSIVIYKKEMQEFIIDNFECLLDFIYENKKQNL